MYFSELPDSVILPIFNRISFYKDTITIGDLKAFLDQQQFFPKQEEIDAIMRRCDHDADRAFNY